MHPFLPYLYSRASQGGPPSAEWVSPHVQCTLLLDLAAGLRCPSLPFRDAQPMSSEGLADSAEGAGPELWPGDSCPALGRTCMNAWPRHEPPPACTERSAGCSHHHHLSVVASSTPSLQPLAGPQGLPPSPSPGPGRGPVPGAPQPAAPGCRQAGRGMQCWHPCRWLLGSRDSRGRGGATHQSLPFFPVFDIYIYVLCPWVLPCLWAKPIPACCFCTAHPRLALRPPPTQPQGLLGLLRRAHAWQVWDALRPRLSALQLGVECATAILNVEHILQGATFGDEDPSGLAGPQA